VRLDPYRDPTGREIAPKDEGRYRIAAEFEGRGWGFNAATRGFSATNFWKGSVRSNAIDISVSSAGR
jgi:hypothetical protein